MKRQAAKAILVCVSLAAIAAACDGSDLAGDSLPTRTSPSVEGPSVAGGPAGDLPAASTTTQITAPTTTSLPALYAQVQQWVQRAVDEDVGRDMQEVFAYVRAAGQDVLNGSDEDLLREACADGSASIGLWRDVYLASPFPNFNRVMGSALNAFANSFSSCERGDYATSNRYTSDGNALLEQARTTLRAEAPPELVQNLPPI